MEAKNKEMITKMGSSAEKRMEKKIKRGKYISVVNKNKRESKGEEMKRKE